MPLFKCSLCDYQSDKKTHIKRHFNKLVECGKGDKNIIVVNVTIECEYCYKKFSTKPNLIRHLKICKIKKDEVEKQLKLKDDEVLELKQKLAIAEALANKPTTINNNININLTPWNNPKLPDDIQKFYKIAVKKLFLAIPSLIKMIHFNEDLPENHTICISNATSGVAKVFNGLDWESITEKILIQRLVSDFELSLGEYAEEHDPKYLKDMEMIKRRDTEEKVYQDLHEEVKRAIYDKKYMIKNQINH